MSDDNWAPKTKQQSCDHYDARHDEEWLLKYDYCYDCGKKI